VVVDEDSLTPIRTPVSAITQRDCSDIFVAAPNPEFSIQSAVYTLLVI
jgi:hypothetical protein